MKKRIALILATVVVVAAAFLPLSGALAGVTSQPGASAPQQEPPIPDLKTLLNYPYPVHIEEVWTEPDRTDILVMFENREDTEAVRQAMRDKGFHFDFWNPERTEVMRIWIEDASGVALEVEAMTTTTFAEVAPDVWLSGALTLMQPVDGSPGLYQAHHTNLDPHLAEVPDPPIIVNGMPYFYITTLRWVGPWPGGRIVYWNYWWFDSHHHPNWYYSHWYWYFKYYCWYDWDQPYWWWWAHGWYYWRYWYYWSTWFPWADYPYAVP
jgi:hypothetical protein